MPSTALLWMCLKPLGNRPPMSLGSMRYLAASLGANITNPAAGYKTNFTKCCKSLIYGTFCFFKVY